MEKQLNEIDVCVCGGVEGHVCLWGGGGYWRIAGSNCLSMHVCVPPGGTNVSFEQFVDSPLSSWPSLLQTGSIFWTLGMPNVSCGHQCVIQMPWLHRHHILLCSWISGLIFCSHAVQTVFSYWRWINAQKKYYSKPLQWLNITLKSWLVVCLKCSFILHNST